jgi:phosphatidate cytidylyltransferase
MTTFQQRALTATVFAAVMLTGLFWNETSFFLLFFIISMGCLWEFLKLTMGEGIVRRMITMILGLYIWVSIFIANSQLHDISCPVGFENAHIIRSLINYICYNTALIFTILFFPIFYLIFELFQKDEKPFEKIGFALLGISYTIYPFQLFYYLAFSPLGKTLSYFTPYIVAGTLFLTWANDTFAYLIGSRIGKTPLLPRISPKKTWEGTIGGAVMCILTGIVISFFFKELPLRDWAVVGGIVAIFGTIGDLVESMLKRSVRVKDSGSFMPGHGGFLDRFDAFIFAVPFVFLYLVLIK